MAERRSTVVIRLTAEMQKAFDAGRPVLLLPPRWPEGNDPLLKLFGDVWLKGSKDIIHITQTEEIKP